MKRVLLFGGTTEGRELCERWASLPFLHVTVCVATSYGRELLSGVPENIEVLEGRRELMRLPDFFPVNRTGTELTSL